MPLPAPPIDGRRYQDLVDELIQRIPNHTPEWTNFNESDPGVTLIQLFAHITESLLYRTNQIPDRNRTKFLSLLGMKLHPGREARGLVAFANDKGPLDKAILNKDTELLAGPMPFLTSTSLDALPIEARLYMKRELDEPDEATQDYYNLLYASYDKGTAPFGTDRNKNAQLYEAVDLSTADEIDFGVSIDRSLWIALLGREDDQDKSEGAADPWKPVRKALANRTLSLGMAPKGHFDGRAIGPRPEQTSAGSLLRYYMPNAVADPPLEATSAAEGYRLLAARGDFDPVTEPGIVELTLPDVDGLAMWSGLEPLEAGVGNLPPAIDDTKIANRIITWLRVSASNATEVKLAWVGLNAAHVRQTIHVSGERVADGDGGPDQIKQLGKAPVLPGSVTIQSQFRNETKVWAEIDDLFAAHPEVVPFDKRQQKDPLIDVFAVDAEAGRIMFGDGLAGRRPRDGEALYASYDYSEGTEGNIGAGAIKEGPQVPAGIKATNPVATWGGADPEDVDEAEKHISRFLQHRERLVTADDFRSIAWRTPGVTIGRIEVLPACHPDIAPVAVGTAPGTVTLMVIPANDPLHPKAPRSDNRFIDALCAYLDPRRLVTTELILRGANYVGIWLSVGIEVEASHQVAEVVDAVKARLMRALSPLPPADVTLPDLLPQLYAPETDPALRGWPLNKAVNARTLLAEAARVPGVLSVDDVLLARGNGSAVESVELSGLELPEILGISVVSGEPLPLDDIRGLGTGSGSDGDGDGSGSGDGSGRKPRLPVPVVAETC